MQTNADETFGYFLIDESASICGFFVKFRANTLPPIAKKQEFMS